jgi:UPF0716 protein FxsA
MGFKARLVFFGYPLAEILILWGVASLIGWGWALLGMFIGIPIGIALMRNAGASATVMMREANSDPQKAAAKAGASVGQFLAGLLFIVPGYLTDLAGAALLIPGVRLAVGRRLTRSLGQQSWMTRMPGFPTSGDVIQGTVIVEDLRYEASQDDPTGGDDAPPTPLGR